MGALSDRFSELPEGAEEAEVQSYYEALKVARTPRSELARIIVEGKNVDEIAAAKRLELLIISNDNAAFEGDDLYIDHSSPATVESPMAVNIRKQLAVLKDFDAMTDWIFDDVLSILVHDALSMENPVVVWLNDNDLPDLTFPLIVIEKSEYDALTDGQHTSHGVWDATMKHFTVEVKVAPEELKNPFLDDDYFD